MERPNSVRYVRIAVMAVFALVGAVVARTIVSWILTGWVAPHIVQGWSVVAAIVGACVAAVAYAAVVVGADADERDGTRFK